MDIAKLENVVSKQDHLRERTLTDKFREGYLWNGAVSK